MSHLHLIDALTTRETEASIFLASPAVNAQCRKWELEREFEEAMSDMMRVQAPARKI